MSVIHVSPSGHVNNNGLSKDNPIPLTRLNSLDFRPEAILFEAGKRWNESLTLKSMPGVGNLVKLGVYGSGALPVLSGDKSITGWVKESNGVYSKSDPSFGKLQQLTIDGKTQPKGRFPKKDGLIVDSVSGTSTITSKGLSGASNFLGAEIIIKEASWVENKGWVTDHRGNTITYNDYSDKYTAKPGYDFFLQNHPACLTEFGDWMYDANAKKLFMYFGNEAPGNYTIKVSNSSSIISLTAKNDLIFEGLRLEYGLSELVALTNSKNIAFVECDLQYGGLFGIKHYDTGGFSDNCSVRSCTIQDTFDTAISAHNSIGFEVLDSIIRRNYVHAGTSRNNDGTGNGIALGVDNHRGGKYRVKGNTFEDMGYGAIYFSMSDVLVELNKIRRTGLTKEDTGAIYTYGGGAAYTNRKIIGNIIKDVVTNLPDPWGAIDKNGVKDVLGAPQAKSIYIDELAQNVEVRDNKCVNVLIGIYLHRASNNRILNNQVMDSHVTALLIKEGGQNEYAGNTFQSEKGDMVQIVKVASLGNMEGNKYIKSNGNPSFSSEYGAKKYIGMDAWRKGTGADLTSVVSKVIELVDIPEVEIPVEKPVEIPVEKPEDPVETAPQNYPMELSGTIKINGKAVNIAFSGSLNLEGLLSKLVG